MDKREKIGLVLLAHGSRLDASNEEVKNFVEKIKQENHNRFDYITYGFLELSKPDIPTALENAYKEGVNRIIVLPYFLAKGTHVQQDIPTIIKEKIKEMVLKNSSGDKQPEIKLISHIGNSKNLAKITINHVLSELDE